MKHNVHVQYKLYVLSLNLTWSI